MVLCASFWYFSVLLIPFSPSTHVVLREEPEVAQNATPDEQRADTEEDAGGDEVRVVELLQNKRASLINKPTISENVPETR